MFGRKSSPTAKKIEELFHSSFDITVQVKHDVKSQTVSLPFFAERVMRQLVDEHAIDKARHVETQMKAYQVKPDLKRHLQIKNIIAIASGKGGVGKSTTTVNLARALQAQGARVGILDADIYGPSLPLMVGAQGQRPSGDQSSDASGIPPVVAENIQTMSIGYMLQSEETPAIWRGPMATRALDQLYRQTLWENLDFLLIDLPPGTGDIALSLVQKIPITAAVVVTTPQDIALLDAKKAYALFKKVAIPVLGIIENMSTYQCSHCGHSEAIFGEGGASRMAEQFELPVLGQLPLTRSIREAADEGLPPGDQAVIDAYTQCALKVQFGLVQLKKDYTSSFGNIAIETKETASAGTA